MMMKMNTKLKKVMNDTSDREKICLFYELGKYIITNAEEPEDEDMENIFDEIANVINSIDNL